MSTNRRVIRAFVVDRETAYSPTLDDTTTFPIPPNTKEAWLEFYTDNASVAVTGEIDIIALDGETLCFVEVKTRRSDEFTPIITNVDRRKQRQITRTARIYRRIFNLMNTPVRFDVVTVLMPKHSTAEIEIVKDFWREDDFRKRNWNYSTWSDR